MANAPTNVNIRTVENVPTSQPEFLQIQNTSFYGGEPESFTKEDISEPVKTKPEETKADEEFYSDEDSDYTGSEEEDEDIIQPQKEAPKVIPQPQKELPPPQPQTQKEAPKPQLKDYEFISPPGFTPPKQKVGEDKRQYGFRVQYYIKKFNNEPVSESVEKKYRSEYKKYIKDKKLINK